MNPRALLSFGCLAVVLTSCSERAGVPPAAVAKPFKEGSEEGKQLRLWVAEPFPAGTTLLDYRREEAWDGTVAEEWILECPDGFAALRQPTEQRQVVQVPADSAYQVLDARLRALQVRLEGDRPDRVWSLDWKTVAPRTSVRGTLYPHADGELLMVERVSLK